jgi:aminomethyltransferase
MTTQDLRSLKAGEGRTAALLTDKAKIVDHLAVYALDEELCILSARSDASASLAHLKRYTLRDDFRPEDRTADTSLLYVLGPRAGEALAAAGIEDATAPEGLAIRALSGEEGFLIATDGPCVQNLALWVPRQRADHWRSRLLEAGRSAGLRPAGPEDYEAVRVESGHPAYGTELSEEVNPLEAGLHGSVSWTKGCYIGQEVVARLDTYQKVQRHLVGLRIAGCGKPPAAGSKLLADGEPVGWVTSAVHSPALGEPVALGYVNTARSETGTPLQLQAGETLLEARVAALPLFS